MLTRIIVESDAGVDLVRIENDGITVYQVTDSRFPQQVWCFQRDYESAEKHFDHAVEGCCGYVTPNGLAATLARKAV